MKKNGFTLAEVLITLGIVGVIAAITIPTLMADTTTAQIGPKLAKAVSSFEQANESLLNANSVDTLTDGQFLASVATYGNALSDYLKIAPSDNGYLSKDGILYTFEIGSSPENASYPAHKQNIGAVTIDINGASQPNKDGTDIFYFSWWNDGSLRPMGATNWDETSDSVKDGNTHWTKQCPENATPSEPKYCAGHVFENNLKVYYK